jgi:hypothetical protein
LIDLLESDSKYQMFNLKNSEFTFDVDMSNLPCGLNGALYFVEMDADGGLSKYSTNKAGAKYGTGYCDAQCPHDIKFIEGKVGFSQLQYATRPIDVMIPRPMSMAGNLPLTTKMLVKENMVRAE